MKVYNDLYGQMISTENLFLAWEEFRRGKQTKTDVAKYEWRLEANIFGLQQELRNGDYKHGPYQAFYITDPKQRLIHKALVRDRVLHHAIFKVLNPIFEPTFIAHSFSCRVGKGTHRGVRALANMLRKASKNHTGPCFALKCDISKFFASVDHAILLNILAKRINDQKALCLLDEIIDGFSSAGRLGKGIPIGNLTSQLFANIYMNEFDQYVKHQLRVKYYVRYTDDFVIVSDETDYLKEILPKLQEFLKNRLALELHPNKVTIRKFKSGVDFLGYVIFPHHIKLRTKTKRRVLARATPVNLNSYLGVLSHANEYKLQQRLLVDVWLDGQESW